MRRQRASGAALRHIRGAKDGAGHSAARGRGRGEGTASALEDFVHT